MNNNISLELLDAAHDRPLQSWSFSNAGPITIGRAVNNDLVVSDPFVSRSHARLEHSVAGWRVVSLSEQLLLCDGQRLRDISLTDGQVFQLGPRGCALRFSVSQKGRGNQSTLTFDPATMPIFKLDTEKLQREVSEISSGTYFRELQQVAQRLRQRQQQ
ncbi:MAG: FHA domain-containing protein [Pirellulales bacterium]